MLAQICRVQSACNGAINPIKIDTPNSGTFLNNGHMHLSCSWLGAEKEVDYVTGIRYIVYDNYCGSYILLSLLPY